MEAKDTTLLLRSILIAPWGFEFLRVPAGSFEMGSPESEAGRSLDEGPRRQEHILEDFWLMRTPVTREQYATATDSPAAAVNST